MADWLGSLGNDSRTTFGDDLYGLQGDDTLRTAAFVNAGLVGGSGSDTYIHGNGALTTILENGNSPSDHFIEAPSTVLYVVFAEIDGRHLVVTDATATRSVVVIDWLRPENRIETWTLGGSVSFSYHEFQNFIRTSPLYVAGTFESVFGPQASHAINTLIDLVYAQSQLYEAAIAPPPPPPFIEGHNGDQAIDGTGSAEIIEALGGNDTVRGLDGNDTIYGQSGDDDVNGNRGEDLVFGGTGADFVRGGQENDTVHAEDGHDWHVNGNIGNDFVYGGFGNDTMHGGPDADVVAGEGGDDRISGDLGNDQLFGDAGADVFVIGDNSGLDTVRDFNLSSGDVIEIKSAVNGSLITNYATLIERTVNNAQGAVIDLGGGNFLTIAGVTKIQLAPDDLLFV